MMDADKSFGLSRGNIDAGLQVDCPAGASDRSQPGVHCDHSLAVAGILIPEVSRLAALRLADTLAGLVIEILSFRAQLHLFAHASAVWVSSPNQRASTIAPLNTITLAGFSVVEGNAQVSAVVAFASVLGQRVDEGGGRREVVVVDIDP